MKKYFFLFFFACSLCNSVFAQKDTIVPDSAFYGFPIVETSTSPYEGVANFYGNLRSRLQTPTEAKGIKIIGKVFVRFVINEKGNLTEIQVIKGFGYGWDEEVSTKTKKIVA